MWDKDGEARQDDVKVILVFGRLHFRVSAVLTEVFVVFLSPFRLIPR
jgi:hypothetical protein